MLDPSDMSTLFQDEAGTTPVTAVEQPVGRILDKSGRGNHATQATTTKRPVLSRRVNLLTKTENFETIGWIKAGVTIPAGYVVAPNGEVVAQKIREDTNAGAHQIYTTGTYGVSPIRVSFFAKAAERSKVLVFGNWDLTCVFDLANGTSSGGQAGTAHSIESAGNGWYLCSFWSTVPDSSSRSYGLRMLNSSGASEYTGDGVSGVYIWGASVTLAIDAHLPYQRVNTATDYDADPAKFPAYLRFDGVDDALQTGNIDFTVTDKMTVWAGVTKLSNAATGTVVELSASKNANNGVFALFAPLTSGALDISWYSKGTNERVAASTSESAPVTRVITGIGDISGDISRIRVNGAVVQTGTADQGTGNYGNYPLYIGARAGTSLYFNGRLYQLIVRGAQSSLSEIEATELYIKQKMRMP